MPELPEVETLVTGLRRTLLGLTIERIRIFEKGALRNTSPWAVRSLKGRRIVGLGRRGKFLLFYLSNGYILLVHLKMTGKLVLLRKDLSPGPRDRIRLEFVEWDWALSFEDQRKFGYLSLFKAGEESPVPLLDELGSDALRISRLELREQLQSSRRPIKSLLLDQRVLAGLGNIYTDECLHRAGIHPICPANAVPPRKVHNLHQAIRRVLRQAIDKGGSTVATFRDSRSIPGNYQKFHRVYGRKGQRCYRCRSIIRYTRVASRGTHFCPVCQREPARRRSR